MRNQQYVSAEDIRRLFYDQPKKRRLSWQIMSASILLAAIIFFFVNGPALLQQLTFWWEHDIQQSKQVAIQLPSKSSSDVPVVPRATPTPKPANTLDPASIKEGTIVIPKIKVQAPIVWDVSAGGDINSDMIEALRKGVARYPQTALPNQVGNVFLTGHSSNYWWEKGNYKTVFALLDRLVAGDMIYVKYHGIVYSYKVASQKVVSPNETSVLNPTSTPVLSLMTCTPTGTSLYRRIVTANLVSPSEGLQPQPTTPNADGLQAIR